MAILFANIIESPKFKNFKCFVISIDALAYCLKFDFYNVNFQALY